MKTQALLALFTQEIMLTMTYQDVFGDIFSVEHKQVSQDTVDQMSVNEI